MENHPIPRQVITFEFKLIGFLTIKQFGYAILFALFAGLMMISIPIPVLNYLVAFSVMVFGFLFVFLKFNERTLDIWIKNLFIALTSAPQFYYHKQNSPPDFLRDIYVPSDIRQIENHVDAHQKLSNYIALKEGVKTENQKQEITNLINQSNQPVIDSQTAEEVKTSPTDAKIPFVSGVIKTVKGQPLSEIMVYVKNSSGQVVRILKTNHRGVFASFRALPDGSYTFEPKDLGGRHFFDTIDLIISQSNNKHSRPISIFSKETL